MDGSGNILATNYKSVQFEDDSGITQEIAETSTAVETSTEVYSWIVLAIVLLFKQWKKGKKPLQIIPKIIPGALVVRFTQLIFYCLLILFCTRLS